MKDSNDSGEPLKIKGSAYSLKNKETFANQIKKRTFTPRIGQEIQHNL